MGDEVATEDQARDPRDQQKRAWTTTGDRRRGRRRPKGTQEADTESMPYMDKPESGPPGPPGEPLRP